MSSEVDAPPELNCKSRAAKTFLKGIWLGHRAELEGIEVLYWRLSCHKNGFLQKFEIRAISLICKLMKLFSLLLAFFQQFVSHLRPIFYPYFMGNFQSLQRGHFTAQNEEKYLMHF